MSSDNKLDLDLIKLQSDVVVPKTNEGTKLNHDGTLSIDCNVLTSMINVGALSGLQIVGNQLIVNENMLSSYLIKLNSNSPIFRLDNNFFELKMDRTSIDFDFFTGNLKVADNYVQNTINESYIKKSYKRILH